MHHFIARLIAILLVPAFANAQATDAEALAFLKKHAPPIHAEAVALKTTDPLDYSSVMEDARKAAADYAKLEAAGDTAAAAAYLKMYTTDFAATSVADELVLVKDDAEKDRLTKKLRQLIADSFDQWATVEEARVRRLEKEIAALKTDLQAALKHRERIITSDTAKLIEECKAHQAKKTK